MSSPWLYAIVMAVDALLYQIRYEIFTSCFLYLEIIVKIECADCEAKYVGETERSLRKWISEHHRDSSPVGHHMGYQKHSFTSNNVSVVHQEATWFKRGVAEAIHITLVDPSLNRDRGRHTLPAIYREVLQSRDPSSHRESRDSAGQ